MRRFRASDIVQLYLVGGALVFLVVACALTAFAAQSQDAINARVDQQIIAIMWRLDRLENYLTASLVALVANFVAHVIQIRTQRPAGLVRRAQDAGE